MEHLLLPSGYKVPMVGLGTSRVWDEKQLEITVNTALELGYRFFDLAPAYMSEIPVGKVVKKWLDSGLVNREDLFIVSKLPIDGLHPHKVSTFMRNSLNLLQLKYVDLYLIHFPAGAHSLHVKEGTPLTDWDMNTNLESVWKAMESLVDEGYAKSIGVSNFDDDQILRIINMARHPISSVQVEVNIFCQQKSLRQLCKKYEIPVCAFCPLGSPGRGDIFEKAGMTFKDPGLLSNNLVKEVADKHGKTTAQVLLRFLVQEGIQVIPKSKQRSHLQSNLEIFDFSLTSQEIDCIRKLDKGEAGRAFCFKEISTFIGVENHPECPKFLKTKNHLGFNGRNVQ